MAPRDPDRITQRKMREMQRDLREVERELKNKTPKEQPKTICVKGGPSGPGYKREIKAQDNQHVSGYCRKFTPR